MLRKLYILIPVVLFSLEAAFSAATAEAQESTPFPAAPAQEETPTPAPVTTQGATLTPIPAVIDSPRPGQAVQGSVPILGSTIVNGLLAAEVSFGYADDPTGTWFLLNQITEPVISGQLAVWDTTTLTDGDYSLRLIIAKQDGSQEIVMAPNVRVRNYTPVETDTPTLPAPEETPEPTETPIPSATPPPATFTPLPQNPAELTTGNITSSVLYGTLIAFGSFAVLGLGYSIVKRLSRR